MKSAGWVTAHCTAAFRQNGRSGGHVKIAELFEEDNRSYCLIERPDDCDLT
jgi:hypothetical protein